MKIAFILCLALITTNSAFAQPEFTPWARFFECGSPAGAAPAGKLGQTFDVSIEPGLGKFWLRTNSVGVASTMHSTKLMPAVDDTKESPDYHLRTIDGVFVLINYTEMSASYDVRISLENSLQAFSKAPICNPVSKLK